MGELEESNTDESDSLESVKSEYEEVIEKP